MVVQKITLAMFAKELERQSASYKAAVVTGMRKTAVFGKTAVVHTIKRTRDPFRIRASGTYEAPGNWITEDIPDGAVLAPIAKHALFVERGRKPGKMPPWDPIKKWVFQKRIFKTRVAAKNQMTQMEQVTAVVQLIRWKIFKKGTKARWPLRRTMPLIAKHAQREVKRQVRDAAGNRKRTRRTPK